MDDGAWEYTGRGKAGFGRDADYAHTRQEYGMDAEMYPGGERRRDYAAGSGRTDKNEFYPVGDGCGLNEVSAGKWANAAWLRGER